MLQRSNTPEANLLKAIKAGNPAEVRRILESSAVNINDLPSDYEEDSAYPRFKSAFYVALHCQSKNLQNSSTRFKILEAILSAKDAKGNPTIDLSVTNFDDFDLLAQVLDLARYDGNKLINEGHLTYEQAVELFNLTLGLRWADGRIYYRVSDDETALNLLETAILTNNPTIVSTVVDLREQDGAYFIPDLNVACTGIKVGPGRGLTALDLAVDCLPDDKSNVQQSNKQKIT